MSKVWKIFETKLYLRLMLALLAGIIMAAVVVVSGDGLFLTCIIEGAVIGGLLCFAAIIPIITEKDTPLLYMAVAAVAAAAFVYIRVCMFYYQSGDYNSFLVHWVNEMRELSLPRAMQADIGDYNMPYLYVLFLISRTKLNDLYLIKAVSCLFDILAAFFVMKIAGHFRQSPVVRVGAYLVTLAVPTVWLNSAFWGQCDVMFAALCLGMAWAVLKGKSSMAAIMWALAFAFKLQAIFALPLLLAALFAKRIKWHALLWILPVFFATLLPAMVCGRGFVDCVNIYFQQADQYPQMHLNIPSVWVLLGHVEFEPFNSAAIFLTGGAITLFLGLCWHWRKKLNDEALITVFYIGALMLPFLLPRMHDRYYYLADLASVVLFFVNFKRWYVPIVTVLSSYAAYRYFLMGGEYLFDLRYFAVALLILLAYLIKDFCCQMSKAPAVKVLEAERN